MALKSLVTIILIASRLSLGAEDNTVFGKAVLERYYDCCKPDCSWPARANFNRPIQVCSKDDNPLTDLNLGSSCGGGPSYPCSDQSPWAVNDTFSYGFVGAYLMEKARDAWCCACYELTFENEELKGKKMVVQAHNSGFDVVAFNRFALAVPGGNTSYAGACAARYGVSNATFGIENEGVEKREDCDDLPEPLREGCRWRFDWYANTHHVKRVKCPTELTDRSQCIRNDEDKIPEPGEDGTNTDAASTLGYSTISLAILVATALSFLL
ncbi:hypothetical protein AJ79_03539 [Helicocarpus griseus UAMH5409]|uniref:cellulase n=1 Tax=Helicocarpus griseus UAMH5409 TaxID=1447875 RepID=A0A2B7XYP1_9EURO|nr:hypothetical protein AJ79_03539 [Helicocarpus griseus UAMH5409]